MKSILIIGGYGVLGRKVAQQLRAHDPEVPLAIAGRDLAKAQDFAAELGNAEAYAADILGEDPGLGLPHGEFSAMAALMMDDQGKALDFAARHGIGFVCVTGGAFELGQQLVMGIHAMNAAPVVMAGAWFCGAAMMPVFNLCSALREVSSINVGILIDRNGSKSGPATIADFQRILGACRSMPLRTRGTYHWVGEEQGATTYTGVGGRALEGKPSVSIDAVSIAVKTGARDVVVQETWGDSLSALKGEGASDEIVIVAEGVDQQGRAVQLRQEIIASREKAPITAIAVAQLLERVAGTGGAALEKGIYLPESLFDPAVFVTRMQAAGIMVGPVRVAPR